MNIQLLTQPMDPEKKSVNFIFPTKYVIPKSLKFSHWPSKAISGKFLLKKNRCQIQLPGPAFYGSVPTGVNSLSLRV